jgi:transcriptional regulator with XRE-family HTH domain
MTRGNQEKRSGAAAPASTLAERLVRAREDSRLSAKDAVSALGWSVNRLRSYELGTVCPDIDNILELARLYSCDAVELAFGARAGGLATRPVSLRGAATPLPCPVALLAAASGPFEAAPIAGRAGFAIYQLGKLPADHGASAAVLVDDGVSIGWVWRAGGKWWIQASPVEAKQPLKVGQIAGRLVAILAAVDPT